MAALSSVECLLVSPSPSVYTSQFEDVHGVFDQAFFIRMVAEQLRLNGYIVIPRCLPTAIFHSLHHFARYSADSYALASIGRKTDEVKDARVRSDKIQWISSDEPSGALWLNWIDALKVQLNRELLLGLFSFESHFAWYEPGDFYQKHMDAFSGEANRVLSIVSYLNVDWQGEDGGELILYKHAQPAHCASEVLAQVLPEAGTLVIFLSEEFPHEVRPAKKDRVSVAGWFRVNTSLNGIIDPPR